MKNLTEEQEGMYFCGICGWVSIENFPHCHSTFTPVASVEQEAKRMVASGIEAWVENGVIFYITKGEE